MEIHFSKLYENGNDFIVIDEREHVVIPDDMKGQFAAIYCDRRFGIGAEGVLFLLKSEKSDLRMRLFRPDGNEKGMWGDGIRCLARYAYDAGNVKETCTIETISGALGVSMGYSEDIFTATITMAPPKFDRKEIPATGSGDYEETIEGFEVHAVNTGAPHAVIIVDAVDAVDLAFVAPKISHHETFSEGASVNFVERISPDSIRIRTFEQGVEDETLSCGSGAMASAAIVHKLGFAGDVVNVETKGGPLTIYLRDGGAKMEGSAATVYTGRIDY
ncbi:diaminopimelate epimerase [Methanoregula sp.]|uniref:diaminopimelate epimerase n=1 Tax=Methanoregula sp. TaxID=2052170 RepID=UPI00262BD6CB|nr:diaminopimelate epimerase [Methanoregula sp.]MDD5142591.1 diaminopimelate epimerase [Methanoregula sp.]